MLAARRVQLKPDADSTQPDHRYEREARCDHKSEFRDEQQRPDCRRHADARHHPAAHIRAERRAANVKKRIWIGRRRRQHHVLLARDPQHESGNEHEHARNSKRDARPEAAQKNRHQPGREQRSEVDDPVERVKDDLSAMLVGLVELVAHEGRHARFDAAGTERDQRKPDVEAHAVEDKQREAGLPETINQAEPEDRVVFPKEPVRDPSAEQREKINPDDESMEHLLRRAAPLRFRQIEEQRRGQEHRQDVAHPVKAEPLAPFVPDDVADLPRNRRLRIRHRWSRWRSQRRINHIRLHRRERRSSRIAAQL